MTILAAAMASGRLWAITDPTLEAGFRAMYGLNFDSAAGFFADYKKAHPSDPMGYAAESTRLVFGELNRLKLLEAQFETDNGKLFPEPALPPDPRLKQQVLDLSERVQQLASARLQRDPQDEKALFALALTNGILGDYSAMVEHRYWGSVAYGREGDKFARTLLQYHPDFYDAYLWTGITNYIYGSLPWPTRWTARFFGLKGDKPTGVANLQLAAEKGRYLKPYAKLLLAITYLREKNKSGAATLLAELSSEFPTNSLFAAQAMRLAANEK